MEARCRSGHKLARHSPDGLRDDGNGDELKPVYHALTDRTAQLLGPISKCCH